MKNILLLLVLLFIAKIGYSQKNNIEIISKKAKDSFVLSAINNNNVQYEVTLTLETQGLNGYTKPITKIIPAKETVEMVTLSFIKGKKSSYKYRSKYTPKPTSEEIDLKNKKLEKITLKDLNNINKGIVVFSKDGCSRCYYTTNYMLDNNINFKFINTSDNKNNRVMWQLLKRKNPMLKSVNMLVILINGKISHSIQDLKGFVTSIKN